MPFALIYRLDFKQQYISEATLIRRNFTWMRHDP